MKLNENLENKNEEIKEDKLPITPKIPHESNELGELFTAIAKAQLDMEVAKTDRINPFFKSKYADLASVVKASRPFLAKNGLAVIQRALPDENGHLHLFTRLCHASGQWMESKMPILPPKQDVQTLGSYITYLRRYNYASMACVVAADEDDDGETAMEIPRKQKSASISKVPLQEVSKELERLIGDDKERRENVLNFAKSKFGITQLKELSHEQQGWVCEKLKLSKERKKEEIAI